MFANEATRRIFAAYEVGDLITMCGWCRRVELDDEWGARATRSAGRHRCTLYALPVDLPALRREARVRAERSDHRGAAQLQRFGEELTVDDRRA
jgi:hypothetical protein